jgi:hypothetical protein
MSVKIVGYAKGDVRELVPKHQNGEGVCDWRGCSSPAVYTTLMGLTFCLHHFSEYYFADDGGDHE